VAYAAKMARIIWAMLATGEYYPRPRPQSIDAESGLRFTAQTRYEE
jgi:hypothetical protein